ncbi:protoporphyrinogen oxidase HemJ [Allorhizobium taibaishanense]|uniref:Protoporphyrinogen IX oxidase n=1 Tax=Allorhizobium taibaishanense TaxID=887144 RepID=A0A1Q9A2K0_9HYPH|nr:protoporphyrinogen oxidase HemJ [Allorhizobium taibaishanense]MBB4008989.1 putative membrane protein [Allorhizobium taibaishanense]OLP48694.1 TIGR00701 family protein [Allorhizobium taibaishanense]
MSDKQSSKATGRAAGRRALIALVVFVLIVAGLFMAGPDRAYLWIKALHVIAIISWMAGLLYMPRLLIYHFDAPAGSQQAETFAVMERRLMNVIMRPAMTLSWILGLYLAWSVFDFQGGWLHAKLAAVLCLTAANEYLAMAAKSFGRGTYLKTPRFWRAFNEIPTVLMIVIVILVVVKPF